MMNAMPSPEGGARLLLRRLRDMMAGDSDKDTGRLELVTALIANTMAADVCSIYVRVDQSDMVLIATTGLNREAVGRTRLGSNEGLVGLIASTARPARLNNASEHPRFSFHPETGEDPYNSFLGVPLLRNARVLGVLTVQDRGDRNFDDEELEALQTIAMLLAEIVELEARRLATQTRPRIVLDGYVLNDGLAIGPAHLHDPVVPATRLLGSDPKSEAKRLEGALERLRASIDAMLSRERPVLFGESRDVLETYRLFAHDVSWEHRLTEAVRSGLTAEAAVDRVRREHRALLGSARGAFLRERLHDLEDLENRLLRQLAGEDERAPPRPGSILVAGRIGPADLLEYRHHRLAGVVLEEAGSGSHAAIIARALNIPALGDLEGLTGQVEQDDPLILDTETRQLHVCPLPALIENYEARRALANERKRADAKLLSEPAHSRDGVRVRLMMNAGLDLDLEHLDESGAEGIGLFRTEFQFMTSESLPSLAEQVCSYRTIMQSAGDKPIVFRTLDLGGDKIAAFMDTRLEQNPAMGWRALRMGLDHPLFFRRQIRALIQAAQARPLKLMFSLVATVAEFETAKALVLTEIEWAQKFGRETPQDLQIGAMVEVPSLALSLAGLAGKADFVSVGTNDLRQFLFAADRDNDRVFRRYGLFSPPMLGLMQQVLRQAKAIDLPISVCGEAANDPLDALALIALGYRELSMRAGRIAVIKRTLRSVRIAPIAEMLNEIIASGRPDGRNALLKFLRQTSSLQ